MVVITQGHDYLACPWVPNCRYLHVGQPAEKGEGAIGIEVLKALKEQDIKIDRRHAGKYDVHLSWVLSWNSETSHGTFVLLKY